MASDLFKRAHRARLWPSTLLLGAALSASLALPPASDGRLLGMRFGCPSLMLTSVPCPGCGMTRSWVATGHGQIAEALAWHPLGPMLWLMAALYCAATLTLSLSRREPGSALRELALRWGGRLAWGLIVLGVVIWLLRLSGLLTSHPHWP